MERNNCTKRPVEETPTATSTKLFEGKTIEEVIRIAQDTVPGASTKTFQETIEVLKQISSNALVYCAEEANAGIDYEVALEAIKRMQADQERAKQIAEEAKAREKEWMSIGEGKVWRPIYAYCSAIISSAYTNPIRDMATAIMNALTASSDKVHTTTVLSLKLTQAYAQTDKNSSFTRMINNINDYMTSIYDGIKSGSTEDGYYKLEDTKYAVTTWIETVLNPNQNQNN